MANPILYLSLSRILILVSIMMIPACASSPNQDGSIADPIKPINRQIHHFNKEVDRFVLGPASEIYDTATPTLFKFMAKNFISYAQQPQESLFNLFSGDIEAAGISTGRFIINTVFGMGGFLDPATEFGLTRQKIDGGVMLSEWGVKEGIYMELPFLGPTNSRDSLGRIIGWVTNPLFIIDNPSYNLLTDTMLEQTAINILDIRSSNKDIINDTLYGPQESYSLTKSYYTQLRRHIINKRENQTSDIPDIFETEE